MELINGGGASENLELLSLKFANGKILKLPRVVLRPGEIFLLKRSDVVFTLRNADESLWLLGRDGSVVDSSGFPGSVPEGKSVARYEDGFLVTDPSPGKANFFRELPASGTMEYSFGVLPGRAREPLNWFDPAVVAGLCLAAASVAVLYSNEYLSRLFFKRDG